MAALLPSSLLVFLLVWIGWNGIRMGMDRWSNDTNQSWQSRERGSNNGREHAAAMDAWTTARHTRSAAADQQSGQVTSGYRSQSKNNIPWFTNLLSKILDSLIASHGWGKSSLPTLDRGRNF